MPRRAGSWLTVPLPWALDLGVSTCVLLLLTAPALFTTKGFVDDWVNHLWLTWMQSREISATGHPSLFLNAEPMGVFYPNFAFYGGTLYGLGGYLMVVVGAPVGVFVGMIVASFATAYGGTLWLARQAGVGGLASHLPAIIVVTGAYYLSIAYGRGSWPELVATSMIPMVVAFSLRIVQRGPGPGSIIGLAAATTIWSGSHNITFAWGTIFLIAVALCLLLAFLTKLTERYVIRIGVVLGVIVLGVMVNGWFLLPDVSYALHTQLAQYRALDPAISGIFSRLSVVFDPLRERATHSTYLRAHFTELPVLVIVWLVLAVAFLWRSMWNRRLRLLTVLLSMLLAAFLVLLVDEPVWQKLPSTLTLIQFTFRLQTYIVMMLAGLTIIILRVMQDRWDGRGSRTLASALALIVLFGLGLGVWQVWNSNAYYFPTSPHYLANRSSVLHYPHSTPPTWYEIGQFRDVSDQVVPTEGAVHLNPALINGESATQTVAIPPGEGPLASNIAASVDMVSVYGLRVAGRTANGFLALERPLDGSRTVRLTVSRADTTPMQLGPLVTLLGALGIVCAVTASFLVPRWRRRRLGQRLTASSG